MPPKVLVTFPGKHGDVLWSLPSVRAIAETIDAPVALVVGKAYGSLVPLLKQQSYISDAGFDGLWETQDTAPISPRTPPEPWLTDVYDYVFHLGYRGWPAKPLPLETYDCLQAQWPTALPSLVPLALDRPWIRADKYHRTLTLGWTDEWFELKYGLSWQLQHHHPTNYVHLVNSPRWKNEGYPFVLYDASWEAVARWLAGSPVFVGDCSALHVLACAVGVPHVVLVEPAEARWNDIFYPYGKAGGKVTLVTGNDGRPTFDARHLWETIEPLLRSAGLPIEQEPEPAA